MVFDSAVFLLTFLPIVYVLNRIIPKKFSNLFLVLASLAFYTAASQYYLIILIFSLLGAWLIGKFIDDNEGISKKIAFLLGIVYNLGILVYYKYATFGIETVNGIAGKEIFKVPNIILPIGISFFTFQAISYIVDVYRGKTKAANSFFDVALYISFFPRITAGPIVQYRDISKQINTRSVTNEKTAEGFKKFIYGLAKKVLISNVLARCADFVFGCEISAIDSGMAWIGALAYTFQIYYDFSGYSDMAIGLSKMFGFDINANFNYPYLSKSVTEFWRKWHISLGAWFREYVYIPLGGSKKGRINTLRNLGIVFLLTGIWHGAAWTYIVWGIYNGVLVIIERVFVNKRIVNHKILSVIYCFLAVNFGWVIFRADNLTFALRYVTRMVAPWKYGFASIPMENYVDKGILFGGFAAVIGMGFLKILVPQRVQDKWNDSIVEAIYCVCILILSLAAIANGTYNPFIYFQF